MVMGIIAVVLTPFLEVTATTMVKVVAAMAKMPFFGHQPKMTHPTLGLLLHHGTGCWATCPMVFGGATPTAIADFRFVVSRMKCAQRLNSDTKAHCIIKLAERTIIKITWDLLQGGKNGYVDQSLPFEVDQSR